MDQQNDINYELRSVQAERAGALQRFNRLYVYLPIGLMGLIMLLLVGWLSWRTIFAPFFAVERSNSQLLPLMSGLADGIFVLLTVPLFLLMLIMPALLTAGIFYLRYNQRTPLKTLQRKMWGLETRLHQLHQKSTIISEKSIQGTAYFNQQLENVERKIENQLRRNR